MIPIQELNAALNIISIAVGIIVFAWIISKDHNNTIEVEVTPSERPLSEVARLVKRQINKSTTFYQLSCSVDLSDKLLLHRFNEPSYRTTMEMIAQCIQIKEAELLTYTHKQAESLRDSYRYHFGLPISKNNQSLQTIKNG